MQIKSVELHSLEAARSLGYITQGTPLYRFAESYDVTIPCTYKETPDGEE